MRILRRCCFFLCLASLLFLPARPGFAENRAISGGQAASSGDCDVSTGVQQVGTTVIGTPGPDQIFCPRATSGRTILSGAGDDGISGSVYGDLIDTGPGNDFVASREGNDRILLGPGDDRADGYTGNDQVYGGPGNDLLIGAEDSDFVDGGDGDDMLINAYDRPVEGPTANDTMTGGNGADIVQGGSDDDTLFGPSTDGAVDRLDGDVGIDTCAAGGGDILQNCER